MVTQPREKADAYQERAVPATHSLTSGCLEPLQAYIPTPWKNVQPPSLLGAQDLSVQKATQLCLTGQSQPLALRLQPPNPIPIQLELQAPSSVQSQPRPQGSAHASAFFQDYFHTAQR